MTKNQRHTLLIVDDEPLIITSICRLIEDMDITLLTAQSGEEALRLLYDNKVAVVLTDQCMPGMSGIDLLEEIHDGFPSTIGLLMSGKKECPEATSALKKGEIHAYLNKPWEALKLIEAIETALEKYRSQADQ